MHKFAVISDIHANFEALGEVLKHLEGIETYCLGDLVDYGAEPNEVIDLIRDANVRSIMGNHDAAALTGDTSMFNSRAAISSDWTRRRLTRESAEFLRGLPQELRLRFDDVETYFTHGSPDDRLWEYVDPRTHSDLFGHYLGKVNATLMGLGHTHIPYVWQGSEGTVLNPGSVGQPRDGDWRAAFALVNVESEGIHVELERVEYDRGKAASKVRTAGLPESFAVRLMTGS